MKTQSKSAQSTVEEVIHREAERCVKCALCAPVCPTYELTQHESESPRGRIALAAGLASHQIPLTAITRTHLDHCLSCRACEAVCPAGVQYGNLFDATQALLERQSPRSPDFVERLPRLLSYSSVRFLLRFYQRSGIQKGLRAIRFLGLRSLQTYDAVLPPLAKAIAWKNFYPARGRELGQVGLFLGCVGKVLDQETLRDSIMVLTHLGYGVHLPAAQSCCGALDLHAGRQTLYQEAIKRNQAAFARLPLKAIISVASGCAVVLSEYPALTAPLREMCEFLNTEPWNPEVSLKPYPHTVMLHTPCTMKNILKASAVVETLLKRIPQIDLQVVPTSVGCCGAAGSHFLRYPKEAKALLWKTLTALYRKPALLVLTTNIGCQLHIDQGLALKKEGRQVMHPIRLIANCLTLKDSIAYKQSVIVENSCFSSRK
jgi:glycolate oxidase iron-sulfur subunit